MNESEVFHKLGQIEAKIDGLVRSVSKVETQIEKNEERLDAVETWQVRAQTRIAATVTILTVGAQAAKEFLSRNTT